MYGRKDDIVGIFGYILFYDSEDFGTTGCDLLDISTVWLARTGSDKRAKTGVPSSIKAMVPCLSSPAAKPSHWI